MKFYIYLFLFASFSSFFVNAVFPQNIKKSEVVNGAMGATLDDYLTRAEAFGFSGALIVEKEGKIILSKGYGWADKAKNIKNTPDTPFLIASVSKQFTAAGILQLEERGKLKTTDVIGKYLKDVPADKSQVTIHQLLTHTWGVGDNAAGDEKDRAKAVRKILAQPFEAIPGEKFIYNNGYTLLAAIVEIVSGQTFESYLRQNIFAPAKMNSAGFKGEAAFYKNRTIAHGYNSGSDTGSPAEMPYSWEDRGGSGIIVSPRDFYQWELALRRDDVVSAQIKSKMFAPQFKIREGMAYGYGWFVMETARGTKMLYHGGNETPAGFTAEFRRYPDENVTTILMVNSMIDEIGLNRVVSGNIASIIFGGKADSSAPPLAKTAVSNLLIYSGTYRTPSGASFKVGTENGRLIIAAENQEAVNILAPVDERFQIKLVEANGRTKAIIETATKDATKNAPFSNEIKALEDNFGKLQKSEILGTMPLNPEADLTTTYVRLQFEKAIKVFRFVWNRANIINVLQNTPLPAATYFTPQSKTDFVGYNLLLKNSIPAKFVFDKKNHPVMLEFTTINGKLQARKVFGKDF